MREEYGALAFVAGCIVTYLLVCNSGDKGDTFKQHEELNKKVIASQSPQKSNVSSPEETRLKVVAPYGEAVAIVIPTTTKGLCKHWEQLARLSINPQVTAPTRIIVGIAAPMAVDADGLACIARFRAMLRIPLTIAFEKVAKGSAGASRNAGLASLRAGEGALMHDDDEYIHPQAVQHVLWSFTKYPADDVVVMSYLWQWKELTVATPWCTRQIAEFNALPTTTDLEPSRSSSNINVKPAMSCKAVHHAYPAFRRSPLVQFNQKYQVHQNRNEDGQFLQALLRAGATMRFTCFPVVAYRSKIPTTTNTTGNVCNCYAGFARGGCKTCCTAR